MRKLAQEKQDKAKEAVLAKGVQLVSIENRTDFVKAMAPVYDKYAPTPELKSLIKRVSDSK